MNIPRILVLGATGKVGGEVVRQLQLAQDSRVIAAVRSAVKAKEFTAQGIETAELDLDRPETLLPALKGVDRALLLTGYTVDMLRQSKRFIDAAKVAGVQHIVHIGASSAPTNEVAHWGWHQYIEAYVERAGAIPHADATFDNFEPMTGRKPTTWRDLDVTGGQFAS